MRVWGKNSKKVEKQRNGEKRERGRNEDKRAEKIGRTGKASNSIAFYKRSPSISEVYPPRIAQSVNDLPELPCTSGDICAVYCRAYIDDVDDITGEIINDWIQCVDNECGKWSHVDCLAKEVGGIIHGLCLNLFN